MAVSLRAKLQATLRSSDGRDLVCAILAGYVTALLDVLHISLFERFSRNRTYPRDWSSAPFRRTPPAHLLQQAWPFVEVGLCALAGFWLERQAGSLKRLVAWLAGCAGFRWDFQIAAPDGVFCRPSGRRRRHIDPTGKKIGLGRQEEETEEKYTKAMALREISRRSLQIARWLKDWPDGGAMFPPHTTAAEFVIVPSILETRFDGDGQKHEASTASCRHMARPYDWEFCLVSMPYENPPRWTWKEEEGIRRENEVAEIISLANNSLDMSCPKAAPETIRSQSTIVSSVGQIGGDKSNRDDKSVNNNQRASQSHSKRCDKEEIAPLWKTDFSSYSDEDSDGGWVQELDEPGEQPSLLWWMGLRRRQKAQRERHHRVGQTIHQQTD
jgi:hypothetical protein